MKKSPLLFVVFLLSTEGLLAQGIQKTKENISVKMPASMGVQQTKIVQPSSFSLLEAPKFPKKKDALAEDFATKELPFFCRQELHWEQKTHVPLRIRMGSVAQTDWLGQKPNASPIQLNIKTPIVLPP